MPNSNNQNFKQKMNTEFRSETDVNKVKQQIQQASGSSTNSPYQNDNQ